jgi:hypothetical protein
MSKFQRATKQASRLRMALIGPAGSGKTYTSLLLGRALGGKLALIDTERGSASKYADLCEFDVLELTDSFHPERYVEAVKDAEASGYATLVIDSLSHAWIGKDGGLDLHDRAVDRQKTKNSFTAWAEVTPHHNALVQALIQCRCHVIATMRAKTEYVMDEKNRPRKVGLGPVMRDGVEYEFDVVGDMDVEHNTLVVTKTRCPALAGQSFRKPGADLARILTSWLGSAEVNPSHNDRSLNAAVLIAPRSLVTEHSAPISGASSPPPSSPQTQAQTDRIEELRLALKLSWEAFLARVEQLYGRHPAHLDAAQSADLIAKLEAKTRPQSPTVDTNQVAAAPNGQGPVHAN